MNKTYDPAEYELVVTRNTNIVHMYLLGKYPYIGMHQTLYICRRKVVPTILQEALAFIIIPINTYEKPHHLPSFLIPFMHPS